MKAIFSTKAGTLFSLQGKLGSAFIAPLVYFKVADWQADRSDCLSRVLSELDDGPWIVRSSCIREDSGSESNAGAFLSVLDVRPDNLAYAINQVIQSYGEASPDDEVLVQPMLRHVVRSGVTFSHDPNTSAPYRLVNWAEGGDTAAVTGGMAGKS